MTDATPPVLLALLVALLAAAIAHYLGPRLRDAALRYGIVDRPGGPLKVHREPVPYLGGLVIFVSFLLSLALTQPFDGRSLAILLSASIVVTVGLIDDLGTLSVRDKLLGELLAAFVLVRAGVKVDLTVFPTPVDEVISILWLMTTMNAVNILDVSDGLATTAATVGSAGTAVIAWLNGESQLLVLSAALFGACLGFLRMNWQPAKMYLGDTGALTLGLLLGALAMTGRYSEENHVAPWVVPFALLGPPLFDLTLVVVARLWARQPVWRGSPDHYALRLKARGVAPRSVALLTMLIRVVVVGAALLTALQRPSLAVPLSSGLVLVVAVLLGMALRSRPPQATSSQAAKFPPEARPPARSS